MPSTFAGFVLFVILFTPGLVYLIRTESRLPGQQYTVIRETGTVLLASILSMIPFILLFGIVRTFAPGATPDVGELIRDGNSYFGSHYLRVGFWFIGLLTAATVLAAIAAVPPQQIQDWAEKKESRKRVHSWTVRRRRTPIIGESGWGAAFHAKPGKRVYLGVELTRGTYLYGALGPFNAQIDETADRTLQLRGPITKRSKGEMVEVADAGAVILSASAISHIYVYYQDC